MFRVILQLYVLITFLFAFCHAVDEPMSAGTILTPPNGSISLDITQMGTLQLGISYWKGSPLTIRNYAQSRVSVLSGEGDTVIAYLDRHGYMNVILLDAEIKYKCLFGQFVRSSMKLSMYGDTFTVINHNNCELSEANVFEDSLYETLELV